MYFDKGIISSLDNSIQECLHSLHKRTAYLLFDCSSLLLVQTSLIQSKVFVHVKSVQNYNSAMCELKNLVAGLVHNSYSMSCHTWNDAHKKYLKN